MLVKRCETCDGDFRTFPSNVAKGRARFCSRKCVPMSDVCTKHGGSRTRLHQIWSHMKTRCFCPTVKPFEYYGARGITVCNQWADSFEAFRDWALANGYRDDLELDRKDTNGNYEPSNCRWATRTQQMQNTRKRCNAKTSKFKGVSLHSQNKRWVAQIGRKGKVSYIGSFDTEIEAARAYDDAARRHFGEFAHLNFPQGGVPR